MVMVLKLQHAYNHLEPLVQATRSSRSGLGLRICISLKLQGDADAAGMGPQFENYCFRESEQQRKLDVIGTFLAEMFRLDNGALNSCFFKNACLDHCWPSNMSPSC